MNEFKRTKIEINENDNLFYELNNYPLQGNFACKIGCWCSGIM